MDRRMAFPDFSARVSTLLLLLTLPACGPKDQEEDTGDDAGTTTTGEVTTSGDDSDPTAPTGVSVTGTSGATASTSATGGTTVSTTTGGDPTATSTSTTTPDTGDTDPPDPVDPPVPCEGVATPLAGITTTIGYLKSQIPPRPDPTGGSTGTSTGGGELEPGTLFVKLSDQAFTCADPNASIDCGPHWEVTIVIPPEFQTPGIHNLLGQDVRGSASESSGGEGCSFGGGSFSATFEILAIDDETVSGRLCNVDDLFSFNDPQLEGSFTATRCPL